MKQTYITVNSCLRNIKICVAVYPISLNPINEIEYFIEYSFIEYPIH